MVQNGKRWHICDDCLIPLSSGLRSIARRLPRIFDVAKADQLFSERLVTDPRRKRTDDLKKEMLAQTEPARAVDMGSLYRKYRIDMAVDWLKFHISVEYATDFKRTLLDAQNRLGALEFKACQIITGCEGKKSVRYVRYPIQRLMEPHYILLREEFPDYDYPDDREQLPDNVRAFEVEFVDEYTEIEIQIREASEYLVRLSGLIQSKMRKDDPPPPDPTKSSKASNPPNKRGPTVNQRMLEIAAKNSETHGWNCRQWAQHLKCAGPTVVATDAWKHLESARLQAKAEQMKDRRRKPKASDRRQD